MSKIKKVTTESIYDGLGNLVKKIETTEYQIENKMENEPIKETVTSSELMKKLQKSFLPTSSICLSYGVIPNLDNDSTYFKKTK